MANRGYLPEKMKNLATVSENILPEHVGQKGGPTARLVPLATVRDTDKAKWISEA